MENEDSNAENARFSLATAIKHGSYTDPRASAAIESLVGEGRLREAFDLLEAEAGPRPTADMYWLHMGFAAEGLGLDERALFYRQRYERSQVDRQAFLTRVWEETEATVKSTTDVRDGLTRIIDLCAASQPHNEWDRFRELPIESDLAHLQRWMSGVLSSDPPSASITGLWFGLFNPVRHELPTADLYVAGAPYDPDDDEWNIPLRWRPEGGEAGSSVLDGIYRIAYPEVGAHGASSPAEHDAYSDAMKNLLGNDAEYPLCLAYAGLAVRWLATRLESDLLLGDATERVLVTGFDSGDYICIGALTAAGLRFSRETFRME